jgi:hypothetical protein
MRIGASRWARGIISKLTFQFLRWCRGYELDDRGFRGCSRIFEGRVDCARYWKRYLHGWRGGLYDHSGLTGSGALVRIGARSENKWRKLNRARFGGLCTMVILIQLFQR